MTRNQLRHRLVASVVVLGLVVVAGSLFHFGRMPIVAKAKQPGDYVLVKDLAPLILGILAIFLTSWYQQRMAFLAALRAVWSHMIDAKTAMLAYAATPTRSDDAYRSAYREISRAIDEMRTAYRNVGEDKNYIGWYPYEPLNDMRKTFESLREDPSDQRAQRATEEIEAAWAAVRWPFLAEFGAPEPTEPITTIGARPQRRSGLTPKRRR